MKEICIDLVIAIFIVPLAFWFWNKVICNIFVKLHIKFNIQIQNQSDVKIFIRNNSKFLYFWKLKIIISQAFHNRYSSKIKYSNHQWLCDNGWLSQDGRLKLEPYRYIPIQFNITDNANYCCKIYFRCFWINWLLWHYHIDKSNIKKYNLK